MKPLRRSFVNKKKSAGQFRANTTRTNPKNLRGMPMRGGIRL